MHFSIKCRKILLSNWFYFPFFLGSIFFVFLSYQRPISNVHYKEKSYEGTIVSKQKIQDSFLLEVKGKKKFQLFISKDVRKNTTSLTVGDRISFSGTMEKIEDLTYQFSTTSYKKSLARKGIFYRIYVKQLSLLPQRNWIEKIRKKLYQYLETFSQTKAYLKTFLLGDSKEIKMIVKESYQSIGISHLFALSGLHISSLIGGIFIVLKKIGKKEIPCFFITLFFLGIYLLLVKQSPSILRASLFFLCFTGNRLFNFHIAPYQILLFILSLLLYQNPFLLEDVGFLYSFSISSSLILFQTKEQTSSFFKKLFQTSLFSFFVGLPITLFFQYQANFASIFYNLFFIPFVSFLIFPLVFLVFFFPFLEPILAFFIFLLEKGSLLAQHFSFFSFPFLKLSPLYYVFLFFFFFFCLKKKKFFFLYALFLLIHAFFLPYFKEDRLTMVDVGQGDCFLFESKGKALLLDVGGKETISSKNQHASYLVKELQARGIRKITILLSHGDQDHAGNTCYLLSYFKVDQIYTNLGKLTPTEKEIKKKAKLLNIPFKKAKEGVSFALGNFSFQQINQEMEEENDSSSVYFVTHQEKTMLFLGDASIKTEENIVKNYDLSEITILKVGHHGSQTSTGKKLLTGRKISLALLSSGRKNKYHHPSPVVLKRLQKAKIPVLNTKEKGSVSISFPTLKIKIAHPSR